VNQRGVRLAIDAALQKRINRKEDFRPMFYLF